MPPMVLLISKMEFGFLSPNSIGSSLSCPASGATMEFDGILEFTCPNELIEVNEELGANLLIFVKPGLKEIKNERLVMLDNDAEASSFDCLSWWFG